MIRLKMLAAMLLACCVSAQAEIKFAIGEPEEDSTKSGIGQISGWAVSDRPIVSVEAFIDGVSVGQVPYGGTREDVGKAFPEFPDSDQSGWSMKWNYSLLSEGEHLITVVIKDVDGNEERQDVTFNTTAFKTPFISDPDSVDLSGATISVPEPGKIIVTGAIVEGELVDIELCWDTATQQFQIDRIVREEDDEPSNEPEENQSPQANAGSSYDVEPGETVLLEGSAIDPDGEVVSYAWKQVTGTEVDLQGANQRIAEFTAPETVGGLRFRLTVQDNDGASDSDDVVIDVVEDEPEPENVPPSVNAGPNRTVETGELTSISGSGSDSDGTIVEWFWRVIDGVEVGLNNARTDRVTFTAPDEAGFTELEVIVTDDDGASAVDYVTISFEIPVSEPNDPPRANAGSNKTVETGDSVTVTGGGNDTDGTITGWEWEQVSGPSVSLSGWFTYQVSFTAPDTAGQIRLRLTVTDNDGATDSDEVVITVEEGDDPDPGPDPDPGSGSDPGDGTTGETLSSMLSAINAVRTQPQTCNGTPYPAAPALSWSSSLAEIAKIHSMDMASQGYFSHTSKDGTSMGDRVFPYWSGTRVGENIAASSLNRSNSYVVNLWLTSTKGHCELLMDPRYTHVGAGAGHNTNNGYTMHHFWTMNVGG